MGYICENCNKEYASRQSRWNHNKKCQVSLSKSILTDSSKSKSKSILKNKSGESEVKIFNCSFCDKIYKHKQSKYKHEKICEYKNKEINKIKILEKQNEDMKLQLEELKLLIQKSLKIHPPDLLEKSKIFLIKSDRPN